MDEDDLQEPLISDNHQAGNHESRDDAASEREEVGTHAIGKIMHEVFDRYVPNLEFVVQPTWSIIDLVSFLELVSKTDWEEGGQRERKDITETNHFVKVFCCTLIHCFSTTNMVAAARHQGPPRPQVGMNL